MVTGEAFFDAYDDPRLAGTESKGDDLPAETTALPPLETK